MSPKRPLQAPASHYLPTPQIPGSPLLLYFCGSLRSSLLSLVPPLPGHRPCCSQPESPTEPQEEGQLWGTPQGPWGPARMLPTAGSGLHLTDSSLGTSAPPSSTPTRTPFHPEGPTPNALGTCSFYPPSIYPLSILYQHPLSFTATPSLTPLGSGGAAPHPNPEPCLTPKLQASKEELRLRPGVVLPLNLVTGSRVDMQSKPGQGDSITEQW